MRTDRFLVIPRADVAPAEIDRWCADRAGGTVRVHPEFGGLRVVRAAPGQTLEATMQALVADGLAEVVEPDYLLQAHEIPSDPVIASGTAWSLYNTGLQNGVADADIDATDAWDLIHDAPDIVVAIVDSGLRTTHEELRSNLWTNPGEIAGNGIDDDGDGVVDDVHGFNAILNSGEPNDEVGHGSHVAGIIGAVGNNGRGIAGVAWKVQLMPLKFIGADGNGATSDAVLCIDYARAHGAQVINASWGGSARSTALQRVIQRTRADGIIMVVSAGNDAANLDVSPIYPASYTSDNLIKVASTTRRDELAPSSNYSATRVDLGAPGEEIYSAWNTADDAYAVVSGTSMAAPHVSGAVALLRQRFPDRTYTEIIGAVLGSADPVPALASKVKTGGRLNLRAAIRALDPVALAAPELTFQRGTSSGFVILSFHTTPGTAVELSHSTDLATWATTATATADAAGDGSFRVETTAAATGFYRLLRSP